MKRVIERRSARQVALVLSVLAVTAVLAALPAVACASGLNPVISQVYGGGDGAAPAYGYDYIEIHNPAASPVSVEGWSVQYASRTGNFGAKTDLHGTIAAGGYLLIRESGSPTPALPVAPDIVAAIPIAMHNTSAKIALVSNTVLIGSWFTAPTVVDFVGYGDEATWWEGAHHTPNLTQTTAAFRKDDGNQDTDNNDADFVVQAPLPRNSSSTRHELNQVPTDVALAGGSLSEHQPIGTAAGTFSTADPNSSETSTYTLVAGTGDADNGSFTVSGNRLLSAAAFHSEIKSVYTVRVRSTDHGGLSVEEVFAITITQARTVGTNTPRLPATGYPPQRATNGRGVPAIAGLMMLALGAGALCSRRRIGTPS
jgi:hypothetical protein